MKGLVHSYHYCDTEYEKRVAWIREEFNKYVKYEDLGPLSEIFNAEVTRTPGLLI